jgi:hypothetical protein
LEEALDLSSDRILNDECEKFEHVGAVLDNLEGVFWTYEQDDMAKSYIM